MLEQKSQEAETAFAEQASSLQSVQFMTQGLPEFGERLIAAENSIEFFQQNNGAQANQQTEQFEDRLAAAENSMAEQVQQIHFLKHNADQQTGQFEDRLSAAENSMAEQVKQIRFLKQTV